MGGKVLVVDDEKSITDGLLALFQLEEIDAQGAYSADEAEELLKKKRFDVVVADVRIRTEEEGYRLLELVREMNPGARLASMTGYATEEMMERLSRLGTDVVLEKPVATDQIIEVVQRLLDDVERAAALTREDAAVLYTELQRSMYAIPVKRYGFDSFEADDIVQQAFAVYLEKVREIESPRAWLTGTIVNLCKQRIHKKVQTREREDDIDLMTVQLPAADDADVLAVRQALEQIDEKSRLLCTLIGIEGRSYDEVSAILDIPVGSVGPTYIRAKAKLRRLLDVN